MTSCGLGVLRPLARWTRLLAWPPASTSRMATYKALKQHDATPPPASAKKEQWEQVWGAAAVKLAYELGAELRRLLSSLLLADTAARICSTAERGHGAGQRAQRGGLSQELEGPWNISGAGELRRRRNSTAQELA